MPHHPQETGGANGGQEEGAHACHHRQIQQLLLHQGPLVLQVIGRVDGAADDAEHVAAGPGHADQPEQPQGTAAHPRNAANRLCHIVPALVLGQRDVLQNRVDDVFLKGAVLKEEAQDADDEDKQGEEREQHVVGDGRRHLGAVVGEELLYGAAAQGEEESHPLSLRNTNLSRMRGVPATNMYQRLPDTEIAPRPTAGISVSSA